MGRLRGFPRRFRWPWRTVTRIERDVDDELAFHIAARTEALQRDGLDADAARTEALRQFGEFDAARDRLVSAERRGERQQRLRRTLEELARDVRFSWRSLWRSPGFTVIAILVLGLGIGVVAGAFSLVNVYALKPVLMADPDEVVAVVARNTNGAGYRRFSYPEYLELRDQVESFENIAAYDLFDAGFDDGSRAGRASVGIASANYFETFGIPLARGRGFTVAEERGEDPPVAVVGYDFWVRAGRDPDMLGSSLRINGGSFAVVGVAPRGFTGTMAVLGTDIWVPLASMARLQMAEGSATPEITDPRFNSLLLLGRLGTGVAEEAARSELDTLAPRISSNLAGANGARFSYTTGEFGRFTFGPGPAGSDGFVDETIVPFALSTIVLLIACLNLANMLLARGAARRSEIWIRQSLGSGRARVVRQLLVEGLLLALAGGTVGLIWSYGANTQIVAAIANAIPLDLTVAVDLRPDFRVILATVLACAIATVLFALMPALRVTRKDLATGIRRDIASASVKRKRFAGARFGGATMIVVQISLSLVMLAVGGLFIRSTIVAANALPPFELDDILLIELHPGIAGYDESRSRAVYAQILDRLRAMPDVAYAGMTSRVPHSGISNGRAIKRAGVPGPGNGGLFSVLSDDYFDALGLPVVRGRDFTAAEVEANTAPLVAILDETFAETLFPDGNALGQQIDDVSTNPGRPIRMTIVGIAPALPGQDIDPTPRRQIYVPFGQNFNPNMTVTVGVRDGLEDPAALLAALREEIRRIDPALPVLSARTMRALRDDNWSMRTLSIGSRLFMSLGAGALFLAVVGLYGVKSFLISRRTREIGVRMALGATRGDVQKELLRQSLAVTVTGLVLGCLAAAAVGKLVSSMLYGIDGMDALVLGGATVVLASAALFATLLPVRHATRIEPTAALRYE